MTEREELERFCADAYPRLVAALGHHFRDRWLAEDLAQEALVRACDRWSRVGRLASPVGWAFHVGVNLGRSHLRRRGAEQRARLRRGPEPTEHHDAEPLQSLALRVALDALTPRQREAVLLRHVLGLNVEETAEILGSTPGAVRGATHRALVALRAALGVDESVEEVRDVP